MIITLGIKAHCIFPMAFFLFFCFFIGNCNSYFTLQRNPPINITGIIFCKLVLMKEIVGPLENSS